MPHVPRSVPDCEVPISTSFDPVLGRTKETPSAGMRTDEEQSNVPFVLNRTIVGTPARALLIRGVYPPFASISIICCPFTTFTFCAAG